MTGLAPDWPPAEVTPSACVPLPAAALDALMPMALVVSASGHITRVGPTLAKLRPGADLAGRPFLEVFALRRPRVEDAGALMAEPACRLQLRFRDDPQTPLKGVGVTLGPGAGMLVNLSFGIGAVEALGVYDLNATDFAATDLTVEMLYLVEANRAVQLDLRRLNTRLSGEKCVAERQASTDTLTGLLNRRGLFEALRRYEETPARFALMHLDLDFFKDVNDRFGHAAGDAVLRNVARVLCEETRENDVRVRTGGDEFLLIVDGVTGRAELGAVAARLLRRLEQPVVFEGHACRVSASIGIAVSCDYDDLDPERMMQDADAALYASKGAGRSRFSFAGRHVAAARRAGE